MIMITKNLELFASKTDLINQTIGMLKKNQSNKNPKTNKIKK